MKRLYCDQSGASAAEYALILATFGIAVALASLYLGTSVKKAIPMAGAFMGPGKVMYTCTSNCQFEDHYYCSAHRSNPQDPTSPTYSPALPALPTNAPCPMPPY